MAISEHNLDEIMNDDRLSPAARQLLLAVFEHDGPENVESPLGEQFRGLLKELRSAGYARRGDAWKSQAGGHWLLFDRWQAETVSGRLPPLPPRTYGRDVLYVIGQPGTAIVKIGVTKSVPSRLKSIQTGSPVPLSVLWWHPGSYDLEEILHREFVDLRLHGEWFDFGVEEPDQLVELAVRRMRPREFPPLLSPREDFRDYLRRFPPGCRYNFLLGGLPPGPFRFPR